MLKRILKMISSLGAGIGITLITQLLLPPAFLHYYGVRSYGEWLVLSGTLSYLTSLNFGITTFASNELTMLYKRDEMDRYRTIQGSTLALILCMIGIGTLISTSVFLLPLCTLLHLSTIALREAQFTAFFLGLQAIAHILGGYYNNLFMVVEEAHRGNNWYSARRLGATLICVPLAMLHVSFPLMAFFQFATVLLIALLTVYDLHRRMHGLPLGLQGASRKTAKEIIAPSGQFGMIFTQQLMIFQAPVILLQWILGPEVVVLFSISRTIFSTARQVLQLLTYAIAPEITFCFANKNMKKLLELFHHSERVIFGVIPVVNFGAFLFAPLLLQLWLHKPFLFDPYIYGLMAIVSGAMSMRDHKQFFQLSTNTHKRLSVIVFFGNIAMLAISIPFTIRFGVLGFMSVWLVSEITQMCLIYNENKKLFDYDRSINFLPVLKLIAVMAISLPLCSLLVEYARHRSMIAVGIAATLGMLLLAAESYFVFGLKAVLYQLQRKKFANAS